MMDYGSMGSGAGLSVMGIAQYLVGYLDQKKNKRPEYTMPAEFQQNLNQAQQQALEGIPEAQKQQYLSNMQRGTAFGLRELGSRNEGLAGVAQMNDSNNKGYFDLMAADASKRADNQALVMAARNQVGDEHKEEFQLNKLNPYYETTAKNEALMGAGAQNLGNGIQEFGGSQGSTGNPTDNISKSKKKSYYNGNDFGQGQDMSMSDAYSGYA